MNQLLIPSATCTNDATNAKPQDFPKALLVVVDQEGHLKPPQEVFIDWSCANRQNKKHLDFEPDQSLLTEYFPFVNKAVRY